MAVEVDLQARAAGVGPRAEWAEEAPPLTGELRTRAEEDVTGCRTGSARLPPQKLGGSASRGPRRVMAPDKVWAVPALIHPRSLPGYGQPWSHHVVFDPYRHGPGSLQWVCADEPRASMRLNRAARPKELDRGPEGPMLRRPPPTFRPRPCRLLRPGTRHGRSDGAYHVRAVVPPGGEGCLRRETGARQGARPTAHRSASMLLIFRSAAVRARSSASALAASDG
jgi:hypothetical protein